MPLKELLLGSSSRALTDFDPSPGERDIRVRKAKRKPNLSTPHQFSDEGVSKKVSDVAHQEASFGRYPTNEVYASPG